MRRLFQSLVNALGRDREPGPPKSQGLIDPSLILCSIPTLSADLPPLELVEGPLTDADAVFHEDDWAQIEFYRRDRVEEIQGVLDELAAFEQAHRAGQGWTKLYVRKLQRSLVLEGPDALRQLESVVGATAGPAPVLTTSSEVSGRVRDGFWIPLGGNIALYGCQDSGGIPVLGASVGPNPDDYLLTEAFLKLNAAYGLMLVDWLMPWVLYDVNEEGQVAYWKPTSASEGSA